MKKPTLFGKYLLLERINVGGMAEVFTAKAFGVEGFERILAIKKILPTMAEDDEFITMFIDEARISVQLNHANIVHIHELGKHEDTYFIAMEYVPGRDLRTILERYRRRKEIMPTAQAVFLASKICEGLDYAHRKKDARGQDLNIIHRDISPQNILISYEGEVKLIDFGIAKAANRSQKTQAGILKGKFGYMSPEQVRGLPIDRRSDIFAVGVILYEMLTGERLFVGESDFSTLEKVRNAEVPAPRQFNPNIPAGLEKVLMKALSGEADTRYQWGSDLQEDLMRFLLAGDAIYSSKHLSAYMKEVFAEDILREAEKMERYASIERPEQIEATGVTGDMLRAARKPQAGPSLPASTRPSPSSASSSARAEYESPSEEDEEPQDEEVGAGDKTQIVDSSSFVFRGQEERESKRPSTVPSGPSDSVLVDDSLTGETAYIADSESTHAPSARNSGKPQVVIGEGEGYAGATVIGPAPTSRPEPEEMDAPNATRVGSPGARSSSTMLSPALTGERPRLDDEDPDTYDDSSEDERTDAGRDPREEEMTGPIHVPEMEQEEPPEKVAPLPKKAPKPAAQVSRKPPSKVIIASAAAAALVLLVVLGAVLFSGPSTGSLMISVQPAGAEVQIDGQAYPQNKVIELPEGVHSLTASSPGHLSAVQEIRVTPGQQPQLISLVLKAEPSAPGTPPADDQAVAATGTGTPSSNPPIEQQQAPAAAPGETVAGTGTGTGTPPPATEEPPKPALFSAVFVGEPGGAEVEVGGKRVGKTPDATLANLTVGKTYTFVATRAGYQSYSGEFRSNGEEQVKVSFVLKKEEPPPTTAERPSTPKPAVDRPVAKPTAAKVATAKPQAVAKGKLACSSRPLGAQIWVDGKYSGRDTPAALGNPLVLPVGSHTIVFKLGSQQSKPQKVTITEGDMAKLVNVQLE
ncbi:serine/threonine protein kinase [Cystobacter fuscus]|uniref:non-specific serine/threonine protein kinase n=1 Tax=Cystobacter fuscus TaxID=43 RepID=A0A250JBY2_9BACT|nr:serine/threonine-protein kinase [Cystobacter fuscus]ATB40686.1 serine/threonine protein kinase [Cystobacter fuscus]